MPRRKGPRRLTPTKVRAIFKSTEPTAKIAAQHGVSQRLVYLIQPGEFTKRLPREFVRRDARGGAVGPDPHGPER